MSQLPIFYSDRMHVDAYFLEYDTERAGDFTPLRFIPKSKQVVLGMVSTKLKELEFDRRTEAARGGGEQICRHGSAMP